MDVVEFSYLPMGVEDARNKPLSGTHGNAQANPNIDVQGHEAIHQMEQTAERYEHFLRNRHPGLSPEQITHRVKADMDFAPIKELLGFLDELDESMIGSRSDFEWMRWFERGDAGRKSDSQQYEDTTQDK